MSRTHKWLVGLALLGIFGLVNLLPANFLPGADHPVAGGPGTVRAFGDPPDPGLDGPSATPTPTPIP